MAEDISNTMLCKVLDLTAERHKVLLNNLANQNTAGFRRQDFTFEEEFSDALKGGIEALKRVQGRVEVDQKAVANEKGNTVKMENELAEINKNALKYQMATQMLGLRLAMERMAATGRS